MTEEQQMEQAKIFPDLEDLNIQTLGIKEDDIQNLDNDDDKDFVRVNQCMALAKTINALEAKIVMTCKAFREYFPEADIETIKIIGTRIDDIKNDEVESISMGFIEDLLTVEGKRYEMQMPQLVEQRFGAELKKLGKLDYYRALIGSLKGISDEIDATAKKKDEFKKIFNEKIDPKYKAIIASPDKLEAYTQKFYDKKMNDPNTSEEMKKQLENTTKWMEYAYTLEPIITTVRKIIKDKQSTSSIIYGYTNRAGGIFKAAVKTCQNNGISFPVKVLTGVEEAVLGKEYKTRNHLFAYLLAWHIKHLGANMDPYEKIFITQTISLITQISHHRNDPPESNPTNEIKAKMAYGLKTLLDLVVDNCK